MDIDSLKTVSKTIDEPVWVGEDIHGLTGVRLQIVPVASKPIVRKINRGMRALRLEHRNDDGTPAEGIQDIAEDEMSLAQLTGWEGFTSKGKDVPYSAEVAEQMAQVSAFWAALSRSIIHVDGIADEAAKELEKN